MLPTGGPRHAQPQKAAIDRTCSFSFPMEARAGRLAMACARALHARCHDGCCFRAMCPAQVQVARNAARPICASLYKGPCAWTPLRPNRRVCSRTGPPGARPPTRRRTRRQPCCGWASMATRLAAAECAWLVHALVGMASLASLNAVLLAGGRAVLLMPAGGAAGAALAGGGCTR